MFNIVKSGYLIVFLFYSFFFQFEILAQNNQKSDLNFDLPKPMISEGNVKYGIKLHTNKHEKVENLYIRDFILVYSVNNTIYDFYYEESDSLFDVIVTSPDTLPRAVINIGFWGLEPNDKYSDLMFKPSVFEDKPSIISFFYDMVNSDYLDLTSQNLKDLKLVVVQIKSKENTTNDPLLYSSMLERIKLQSRYLYLLWDTSKKERLPDQFKNANTKIYPLERSTFLSFFQQTPLNFSMEIDNTNNVEKEKTAHINFVGNFKDSLRIDYEIYNEENEKEINSITTSSEGISINEKLLSRIIRPDDFIKVVISKPPGYNITRQDEDPGYKRKNRLYEFYTNKAGNVELRLSKIPTFDFFYLDVSSIKNRRIPITEIYEKINSLTIKGNNYYLFVSNSKKPLIANGENEYKSVLGTAGSMMPDPPDVNYDVRLMLDNIDWDKILEDNREINIHYYIPVDIYKMYNELLITNFLYNIENRTWNVYINTDGNIKRKKSSNNDFYKSFIDK